jgi:hypothetical protein
MIRSLILTFTLAGSVELGAQSSLPHGATRGRLLVITHATIVDTRGGPLRSDMSVVIRDGRIVSIAHSASGQQRNTSGATVLNARGKFLIPGFWDMAVHLSWTTSSALPILVANGVTSVRDMGGRLGEIDDWRTKIAADLLVGPDIVRVGPMLNGKSYNQFQMALGTPEESRGVVRTLKFIGVDGINLERRVQRASYFSLLDEARHQSLPVGGHVPLEITPREATDSGQTSIENVETLFDGTFSTGLKDDEIPAAVDRFISTGAADTLFRRFVRNHTAVTPVIAMFAWTVAQGDSAATPDPRLKYVASSFRGMLNQQRLSASDLNILKPRVPAYLRAVQQMNRDSVLLLAGTDVAGPRIPGFSLHDELAMLVTAGLSPLQAIQTATINPALVLHQTKDRGTVETGKIADLVLLEKNPLSDIRNTTQISAVVLRGRLFTRADLDALLSLGQRLANDQ